jgi:uncharacterized protein (DUF1499 family)
MIKKMIFLLLGLVLFLFLFLAARSFVSRKKHKIGMAEGRLKPCPENPNCVCSEEIQKSSWIKPLAFKGPPAISWERAKQAIRDHGGRIEKEQDGYLWATFTTMFFRFVDDLELRMDDRERMIHVRSASRMGYSDLGVNRRRVEKIRARFNQGLKE